MKVKLNPKIDNPGQGFLDPEGQKIRAKHPKPGEKFQKGQIFDVEETDFVREKISSGELQLATETKAAAEKEKGK